jgi:hypothetical protein
MITPIKKPAYREPLAWEKEFNAAVNRILYLVERTIANSKTWWSSMPTIAGHYRRSP